MKNEKAIAIIVGDKFENLEKLISSLPVWAPDIPKYRAVQEPLRSQKDTYVLTLYKETPAPDSEEELISWLSVIDEHHPHWTAIEFYGLSSSGKIQSSLEEFGVTHINDFPGGFRAIRPDPKAGYAT